MKKRLVITSVCALSLCLCTAVACESLKEGDESKAPVYSGQHGEQTGELLPPAGDPITLDGKLDEAVYQGQSWLDAVSPGTSKEEAAGCKDVEVKATSVYGQEGIYFAFDVSNSFVYVDLAHARDGWKDSGISLYFADALGTNYEISLSADGYIFVCNGHELNGVICEATFKGEVNTPDLSGYILELYIPWKSLGYQEAQAAMQLDLAVVVSMDEAGDRNGWESLGEAIKKPESGWQWQTPSTYWKWGKGGWENAPVTLNIEEYDSNAATVSPVKENYQAGEDIQINIEPKAGYAVKTVLVNGEEMRERIQNGVLTLAQYGGALIVTVKTEFVDLSAEQKVTVSGKLTATAGLSGEWALPAGTNVSFVGTGVFNETVGTNGTYSVELPAGTYTVTADNCAPATLIVGAEDATQNLLLRYNLFTVNGNSATVSADGTTFTPASGVKKSMVADLNVNSKQFVLTYRAKGIEGGNFVDGFGLTINGSGDQGRTSQFGYIENDKSYRFRWTNEWSGTNLPFTDETVVSDGLDIMIVRNGNDFTQYYRMKGATVWTKAGNTITLETDLFGIYVWNPSFSLTDISYTPNLSPLQVKLGNSEFVNGSVTLSGNYSLGDDVVLNITPDTGYLLASITVNGEDKTPSVTSEGKLTFSAYMGTVLNVEVTFAEKPSVFYTVSGSIKATAGASGEWAFPAGTNVAFVGTGLEGSYATNVAENGTYSIELPAGTYTVTAEGYSSATLTVGTAAMTKDFVLVYNLLVGDGNATITGNTIIPGTAGGTMTSVNINSNEFVLTYHVTESGTNSADGVGFKAGSITMQFGYVDGNYRLRFCADNHWVGAVVNNFNGNTGVDIMIVNKNGTYSLYYRTDSEGNWTFADSMAISGSTFVFTGWAKTETDNATGNYKIEEIAYTPNLSPLQVTLGNSEFVNGSVSLEGNYMLGDDVVLNITPDEDYLFASVTVNGEDKTASVTSEGKLTLSAYMGTVLNVEVTFAEKPAKTYTVSGEITAQSPRGISWGAVPAGLQVTFAGEATYYATTNEHGAYEVQLPAGDYTVTIQGYLSTTLNVTETGDQEANLSVTYKVLSDVSDVTANEVAGTVSSATGSVSVPINVNSEQFVLEFTIKGMDEGDFADKHMAGVKIDDGSTVVEYQFLRWGSNAFLKLSKTGQELLKLTGDGYMTLDQLKEQGIQAKWVRNGNTFTMWVWSPLKDKWVSAHTYTLQNEFSGCAFYFWKPDDGTTTPKAMISDFVYTPNFDPLAVSLKGTEFENGSVSLAGNYMLGDTVTLNVAPKDGYMVSSLKVNGVEKAPFTGTSISFVADLLEYEVEAKFIVIPDETYTVSGSITGYFGNASNSWVIPQNTTVSFRNDDVAQSVTVGANGAYEVDLPAGEYTVTVSGYLSTTLRVTETADQEANFSVCFDLLQDRNNATISADESEVKATAGGTEVFFNTLADEFVLYYTAKAQDGNYQQNIYMQIKYSDKAGYWQFQNLYWGGNLIPKKGAAGGLADSNQEQNWTQNGNFTQDDVNANGWKNIIVKTVGTIYWYIQKTNGEWVIFTTVDATNMSTLSMYIENTNLYYTDLSYAPNLDSLAVSLKDATYENGSVSLAGNYRLCDTVTLNVVPKDGYMVSSLKVNGVEKAPFAGTSITFTATVCEITVEAVFEEQKDTSTVSGTVKATAGASGEWALPTGTQVTFVGTGEEGSYATNVAVGGAYSVDLPAGTYTVTAEGYSSTTLTVGTAAMTKDFVLVYNLLNESAEWTVSDNESTLTPKTEGNAIGMNVDSNEFVLTYHVTLIDEGKRADGLGFRVYIDGGNRVFQFGYIDGGYALRITDEWSGAYGIALTNETVAADGIDIMIVRNGNVFKAYYRLDSDSVWTKAGNTLTLDAKSFAFYNWSTGYKVTDFTYTPNLDNAPNA